MTLGRRLSPRARLPSRNPFRGRSNGALRSLAEFAAGYSVTNICIRSAFKTLSFLRAALRVQAKTTSPSETIGRVIHLSLHATAAVAHRCRRPNEQAEHALAVGGYKGDPSWQSSKPKPATSLPVSKFAVHGDQLHIKRPLPVSRNAKLQSAPERRHRRPCPRRMRKHLSAAGCHPEWAQFALTRLLCYCKPPALNHACQPWPKKAVGVTAKPMRVGKRVKRRFFW